MKEGKGCISPDRCFPFLLSINGKDERNKSEMPERIGTKEESTKRMLLSKWKEKKKSDEHKRVQSILWMLKQEEHSHGKGENERTEREKESVFVQVSSPLVSLLIFHPSLTHL
ncbi:hypothetical protein LSTR_LSTR015811 [Laodelphax striatellus]|uniref:Uncharacterized protein n=1 Tax=Laodelphax striatellus TaxID=195883 RepID=A0A482XKU2_LAOST|nr:hypothetical protein LSTR_LSTR015811 [Laodelphax striatellus]